MLKRYILKFSCFFLGCLGCFYLQHFTILGPVLSSCIIGLLGTFIPLSKNIESPGVQGAIFCGSFAGMCSAEILSGPLEIFLLSFLGAFLFLITKKLFVGIGGKLGAVAFVSVALMYLIKGNV